MTRKLICGIIGLIAGIIGLIFGVKKEVNNKRRMDAQDDEIRRLTYSIKKSKAENEARWQKIDKIIEKIEPVESEEEPEEQEEKKEEVKEEKPKPKVTRAKKNN